MWRVCHQKKYLASPHCIIGLTTLEWSYQMQQISDNSEEKDKESTAQQ